MKFADVVGAWDTDGLEKQMPSTTNQIILWPSWIKMEKILEKFRSKSHSKIDNTHTRTCTKDMRRKRRRRGWWLISQS
jgi:hypothetical protein